MRIPSGVTDQYIYFVAVDATDLKTRETGLTTWTVYRSRNGGAAAAMTTPTINETDTTNMPGVYELLLDEDMTIDSGDDSQEMVFHITHAGMAPVTRVIELYRPKITAGNTLDVTATGAAGIDWGNVENPTTAVDLSGTDIQLCDTITTYTGNTVQTGDSYARLGAPAGASIAADIAVIEGQTDDIGVAGAGLTAVPWNASWDAEVQSECTDALNTYDPPTNTEMTSAFTEIKGATWASGTDTLEAIRDRGDAAWTTGAGGTPPQLLQSTTIATLASQTSFTLTAGSTDDDAYNNAIAVVTDQSTSTQKAVGTVSDYTGSTKTVTLSADPAVFTMAVGDTIEIIAALGSAGSAPTAAAVADAVWDEAQADHVGAGSFGEVATEVASILADTATDGVVLSAATQASIADTLLNRNMATGTDDGTETVRTVRQALRFLRNKWSISGTTLTVTKEDDSTASWTATVTTDATADPVTGNDPASA